MFLRKRLTGALAVLTVATTSYLAPATAQASSPKSDPPSAPPSGTVERFDFGDGGIEITYGDYADAPSPSASTTVETIMTSTDQGEYAALASCKVSISASKPYKGTYSGSPAATGVVSFSRSSGCSGEELWLSALDWEDCAWWHGCDWKEQTNDYDWLKPGRSVQVRMWKVCANSHSDRWRTTGRFSGSGDTVSPAATLSCGR